MLARGENNDFEIVFLPLEIKNDHLEQGFPTRGPHVAREAIMCGPRSQMLLSIFAEIII